MPIMLHATDHADEYRVAADGREYGIVWHTRHGWSHHYGAGFLTAEYAARDLINQHEGARR